jgi:hypothetical protein
MMIGPSCDEMRCMCGHLIAKWRKIGIELKCKRCKHLVVIPFEAIKREASPPTALRGDKAEM